MRPLCFCPDLPSWICFEDSGRTLWLSLAHVRQVEFTEDDGEPYALVWTGRDLWEIADPAALAALAAYVQNAARNEGPKSNVSRPFRAGTGSKIAAC